MRRALRRFDRRGPRHATHSPPAGRGRYTSCGEHGGRYCFYAPTNEGPIYLYFDQAADNWCIGDQIGSQSYYAVCGPSNGEDMMQEWRIWTGDVPCCERTTRRGGGGALRRFRGGAK